MRAAAASRRSPRSSRSRWATARTRASRSTDIDVAVRPIGVSDAAGTASQDKAFFPETAPDTDHFVTPLPAGVDLGAQLRSPDSPERFRWRLDLPDGARLQLSSTEPGAEIIAADGAKLAHITAPVAWDADDGRGQDRARRRGPRPRRRRHAPRRRRPLPGHARPHDPRGRRRTGSRIRPWPWTSRAGSGRTRTAASRTSTAPPTSATACTPTAAGRRRSTPATTPTGSSTRPARRGSCAPSSATSSTSRRPPARGPRRTTTTAPTRASGATPTTATRRAPGASRAPAAGPAARRRTARTGR